MSSISARALWFLKPLHSVIRETKLPHVRNGKVKLETKFSAISPGTERLVFKGQVPESMISTMAVPYMEGDFHFPIKYGYSLVGEIIQGKDDLIGRRVHVMHPHQDYAVVEESDLFFLPKDVNDTRGTLISNLETCVNAIWDSQVRIGDRVLIVGYGSIGSLLSLVLKQMQLVEITVVDVIEEKLKVAENLGFNVLSIDQVEQNHYDLAFNTSSSSSGLQLAINAVAKDSKVVEMSWYGSQKVSLNLGQSFHILRKQIISSQVSTISPLQQSRWDYQRRKQFISDILKNAEFDKLITNITPFNDVASHFLDLCENGNSSLSQLIDFR